MAIEPITRKRQTRRFFVYDLEWARGSWTRTQAGALSSGAVRVPEIRLAGVYDGRNYRAYRTIDAFLDGELHPRNHNVWFYAHAGGLADMLFVMQRLIARTGVEVKASFSGSSAIIVTVKRGRCKWFFVDSLWLFGTALANVAKWIGMEKGTVDFETDNFHELQEYNRLDCVILWRAIDAFETALMSIGGELCMTLASCAMRLFRRRFLHRTIETNPTINLNARSAYFGSRVEVIERGAPGGYYYDINSSFPHAMTEPSPGNYMGATRSYIPDRENALFIADVSVSVPESHLPPLPLRHEGSVFFPVGKTRGWYNETDLRLLESKGGRILKVHEVNHFAPFTDLAEYATTLYELRRKGTTDFEKVVYKLLLNSLYGKFAENPLKQSLLVNPPFTSCPHWPKHPPKMEDPREPTCMTQLIPGVWLLEEEADVPHEHVPISARITAIARRNILNYMEPCARKYYCDTDGFATNESSLPTSDALGGLKLELRFGDALPMEQQEALLAMGVQPGAEFLSPKVYRIDDKVKAKGMSLGDKDKAAKLDEEEWKPWIKPPKAGETEADVEKRARVNKISFDRWLSLREGGTVQAERMSRIRELYRSGGTTPITRMVEKQLRYASRPKRFMYKDGTSRPWTIDELRDKK